MVGFLTNRISVVRTNGFPPFFTPKYVGVIDILFVCFVCDADMLRQGISHLHKPTPRCQSCTSWSHLLSLFTARDFRLLLKGNLRGRANYLELRASRWRRSLESDRCDIYKPSSFVLSAGLPLTTSSLSGGLPLTTILMPIDRVTVRKARFR